MLRWNGVTDITILGMTTKLYREPFQAAKTVVAPYPGLDLDHYAYRFLGSELFAYRVLDVNFERYMEERGDMSRIEQILLPTQEEVGLTVL